MSEREKLKKLATDAEAMFKLKPDGKEEYMTCPLCDEGEVEAANYDAADGYAAGIQVFGIGRDLPKLEAYVKEADPSTILALLSELEQAERERDAATKRLGLKIAAQEGLMLTLKDQTERAEASEAALRTLREASAKVKDSAARVTLINGFSATAISSDALENLAAALVAEGGE